jgi:hypothetical protein
VPTPAGTGAGFFRRFAPINSTVVRRWVVRQPGLLCVLLPLATGVGLLVYGLTRVWLLGGILAAGGVGTLAAVGAWRLANDVQRTELRRRVRIGLVTGVAATLCYDGLRYVVVMLGRTSFWPFDTFGVFGMLIVGDQVSPSVRLVVGTLYHYVNGVGFAVAFLMIVRRPTLLTGLAWAAFLEVLMLSIYPTFLDIKAYVEFVDVSIIGHAGYGATLGILAGRAVAARRVWRQG